MRTISLGSITGTGTPAAVPLVTPYDTKVRENVGVFQVGFAGTATATLEGSLSEDAGWTLIASILSTDSAKAKVVALMPRMRMNVTAHTSGAVTGYLGV